MKILTLIKTTDENSTATVTAEAFSKDAANIVITAGSLQEATNLLQEGTEKALAAMQIWTPTEAPAEDPVEEKPQEETYRKAPISVEAAQRKMEDYEATTTGRRFKRGLDLAKDFTLKHSGNGFSISQMHYLMLAGFAGDWFETVNGSYCYGFRRGYNAAIKKGGK